MQQSVREESPHLSSQFRSKKQRTDVVADVAAGTEREDILIGLHRLRPVVVEEDCCLKLLHSRGPVYSAIIQGWTTTHPFIAYIAVPKKAGECILLQKPVWVDMETIENIKSLAGRMTPKEERREVEQTETNLG